MVSVFTFVHGIAGMFGWANIWRIAELKVFGTKKFGESKDFGHKGYHYKLKFGWLKFGEVQTIYQICQTFSVY